MWVRFFFFKQ